MKLKDRMIKKLLSIGKKHRILVYPTLALVAIISAASHAICWGRGNGRKVVASVLVMALLVTQSIFLTSSADDEGMGGGVSDPVTYSEPVTTQINMNYNLLGVDGSTVIKTGTTMVEVTGDEENGYTTGTIAVPTSANLATILFSDESQKDNFEFSTPYYIENDTNTNFNSSKQFHVSSASDSIEIYLQATRIKYPAVIRAVDGVEGHDYFFTIPVIDDAELKKTGSLTNPASYTVLGADSYVNGSATVGAYKLGYKYAGLTYNSVSTAIGNDVTIAPTEYVSLVEFTPGWTPYEYDITYVAVKDSTVTDWPEGNPFPSQVKLKDGETNKKTSATSVTYGADYSLVNNQSIWASNEAYYLSGWYDASTSSGEVYSVSEAMDGSKLAKATENITDDPNVAGKTLYAVWTYKNISLSTSGNNISVGADDKISISATYGDSIDCTIKANYTDDTDGSKFKYAISQDASDTTNSSILQSYGLVGYPVLDGDVQVGYNISGTLKDVTEGKSSIEIPLYVTDENKDSSNVTLYTIKIDISKREVTIDPSSIKSNTDSSSAPSKPYDGTALIGVASTAEVFPNSETQSGKLTGDSVYVSIGDTNATLEDVSAGDNKTVILHNVSLQGDKANMYKLNGLDLGNLEVENVARVTRKALQISIERVDGSTSDILFGQDTPAYRIVINDASLLAGDATTPGTDEYNYVNLDSSNESARTQFMTNVLGFTSWSTTRKLYSSAGEYSIAPTFDNSSSNYTIETTGASASFTVVRENAEKDTDYKYSTNKASNGYYPGLVITPKGDYDLIRLIGDEETDITETMTKTEALANFKTQIKIDDCVDKPIRFQVYDSETGSITNVVSDTVSVDNSVPVYVSHSISDTVKDKINSFDFGSYYHIQDGIETIQIDFVYNADYSDCSKLYYYFVPDGSDVSGGEISVNTTRIPGTNNYTGTITIGTGSAGQLVVYAMNSTGMSSVEKKIRIDSATDYADDNDYYEWMIENTKIAAENIVVTDIDDNVITSSEDWHNGIKFSLPAEDNQSGVWKIEWTVKDEDGNIVSTDSSSSEALAGLAAAVKEYGKITSYTFKNSLLREDLPVGKYTISAVVYDNAGNKTDISEVGPFLVDCKPPVITDTTVPPIGEYQSNVVFKFKVTEDGNESGLDSVMLYDVNGANPVLIKVWGVEEEYTHEITANGRYLVVATDKAGNEKEYEKTFSGISESIPDKPVINVTGTLGNEGWYYKDPVTIHIRTTTKTADNVPIETGFKLTFEDHYSTGVIPKAQADDYQIPITEDGQVIVETWATSEANLSSGTVSHTIKVDTTAPTVIIEESSVDEDGYININYKVLDDASGVDKVMINGQEVEVVIEDGIAKGSFKVTESREYIISAVDVAGNESGDKGFSPLVLKASPVMNITATSAILEADVIEGTYLIDDCYIAYKKHADSNYSTALVTKDDTVDYGIHMEASLRNLSPETTYDYKIYAITKTSKEMRVIEGSFKTTSETSMASIKGSVVYSDELTDEYEKYPVYVSLFEGNTYIAGCKLEDETDTSYEFNKIADGTYRIVATDGLISKTKRVVVKDGGILEPSDYLSTNGIKFVLDGMSTEIIIEDNSINVAADGLDKIFESSAIYEGVITREDKQVIADGGSVNVALHAQYITEDELSSEELAEFQNNMSEGETVEKYISLYIEKTVRDKDGLLVYAPTRVPILYDDISITFPLGELQGKKVYVAMAHKEQSGGYTFKKWDGLTDTILTDKTVTINTNLFSVYALYTKVEAPKTYVVKWIDGDGVVLKTELVEEGMAAIPPTGTPTKTANSKQTFVFGGWDKDYSSITKDTIIAAWFTAKDIDNSKPQDTNEDNKTPETEVKPGDSTNDKEDPKYSYMGSDSSPKTGDSTPIMMLISLMIISMTGIILIRKRQNKA